MALLRRAPNVEKMKRKGDVDGLVRALLFEDRGVSRDGGAVDHGAHVRLAATRALAEIDSQGAVHGLLRALDDPHPSVRIAAVNGLRERGDPLAGEGLTSAATNWTDPGYSDARAQAVETLAFLRDPMTPRRVAAGLLTRSRELDDEADADVFRTLARAGGHDAVADTVADLVSRLREGSAPARTRKLLVWLAPDSVEPLIEALAAVPARGEAIAALGEMHDSRAVEGLCSVLLGDSEPHVRAAAAHALGEIRDPAAVEALLLACRDPDYEIRTAAADSFDRLGNAAIAVAMMSLVQPTLGNGAHLDEIETAGAAVEPSGAEVASAEAEVEPASAEAEPPVAEAEPPVAEAEPPVAEAEPPIAEAEPPVAEAEPPVAEAEPPVGEAEPPVGEAEPPVPEPEPPVAEPEPPVAQVETDTPEDEAEQRIGPEHWVVPNWQTAPESPSEPETAMEPEPPSRQEEARLPGEAIEPEPVVEPAEAAEPERASEPELAVEPEQAVEPPSEPEEPEDPPYATMPAQDPPPQPSRTPTRVSPLRRWLGRRG